MATITAIKDSINRLDSAGFQILCDDYLSRIGYPNLVSLGTMAGANKTTSGTPDTYFPDENKHYVFAEYTTQKENIAQKIKSDIQKCFSEEKTHISIGQISEIVYCHTSSNLSPADDHGLREYCANKGVLLTLIGIDLLADDIFWKYQVLAKEHLGLSIDTEQILSADDYFKQYDSNIFAAPLETVFWGREKEFKALADAFNICSVVIVTGAAGVGKTKLSIEFAKKHASEKREILYCIHSRGLGLFNDINMYFSQPGKYFVVVDDANQITDLSLIVDLVKSNRKGFSFCLLLTVRDYAINKVKNALNGCVRYEEIKIEKLKDDEIKALVTKQYGIRNHYYLDRIITIAEGNARMAVLAGKLATGEERLDVINDASQLYDEYYSPVLQNIGLDIDTKLLSSLGVVSFLGTLLVDHIEPVMPILAASGIDKDAFLAQISHLSDIEIVDVYHDRAVRISDQCIGNYILKYVFCDNMILSLAEMIRACFLPYKQRTIFAVNTLMNVFRSTKVHEFVSAEITSVWNYLKVSDQKEFWAFLHIFFPINPVEALIEIEKVIDNTPAVSIAANEIDTENRKNYQSVDDDVISILCGYADSEDLETALDLFFQYYLKRPDKYMEFYHASTIAFNIHRDSDKLGFRTQILFLSKIVEYANDWNNDYILILFLEVARELLQLEFSPHESSRDGNGITIYHIFLHPSQTVTKYRELIWTQLEIIAKTGKYHDRLRNVFSHYGRAVAECSIGVIQEDAPSICKVIAAAFSPTCIEDCKTVAKVDTCFKQYNISAEQLQPFLISPYMKAYQVLSGPGFSPEYDFEKRKVLHKTMIKEYIDSSNILMESFSRLLTVYSALDELSYEETTGINIALQMLSDDKEIYLEAVQLVLANNRCDRFDTYAIVQTLFSFLSEHSVLELIRENAYNPASANIWLYAYYHELPIALIDGKQLEALYCFLADDSDAFIQKSPYRDIFFLKKYLTVDRNVFIKAAKIILEKRTYSPFIVSIYFEQLFNPYFYSSTDTFQVFQGHIDILEDIYFFLLHHGSNDDHEGTFLKIIAKEDICLPKRLSTEFLCQAKNNKLYEVDTRFSALYDLDNYIEFIDSVINEAIRIEEYAIIYVPIIIKQFLFFPEKRKDLETKVKTWVQNYVFINAQDKIKMRCLFEAISECSPELRREAVGWFVNKNPCFEDFKDLSILPGSYVTTGSFVPVYNERINYLTSLLPLFHGVKYLQHKNCILERINDLKEMITEEEIAEFIMG